MLNIYFEPNICDNGTKTKASNYIFNWYNHQELDIFNWYNHQKSDILLLLGEPGHGKSSFCKKMVYDYYCNKIKIKMFYFSLNPNDSSIILNNKFNLENVFQIANDVTLSLEDLKNSIVFLDGFDELYMALKDTDCKNISNFISNVLKYIQKGNNVKVVITSRKSCININDKILSRNTRIISLAHYEKEDHEEWIDTTYNILFQNKYDKDNLQKLYNNKYLNELIKIPILFQLIIDNDINSNVRSQVELYQEIFEEIVTYRQHETVRNENEHIIQKELEEIAFFIFRDTDKFTMLKDNDLLKDNDKNLKLRVIISFYMNNNKNKNSNEHTIEFIHRSFYQYFLAYFIYHNINDIANSDNQTVKAQEFIKKFWYRHLDIDILNFIKQIFEFENNYNYENTQIVLNELGNIDLWCSIPNEISNYQLLDNNICKPYVKQKNIFSNILSVLCFLKNNSNDYLDISDKNNIIDLIKLFGLNGHFPYLKCKSINLNDTCLKGAYLASAYLNNIHLNNAHLERAHLEHAHLERAHLEGAYLEGAYLNNANLKHANLESAYLDNAHLDNAHLEHAHLADAHLKYASLGNANLKDAYLDGAYLGYAHLEGAHLEGAHLEHSTLEHVNLDNSTIEYAYLDWAKLDESIIPILEEKHYTNIKKILVHINGSDEVVSYDEFCRRHRILNNLIKI